MDLCFLLTTSVLNPGHNQSISVVWSPQDFLHRVYRSDCYWCTGTPFSVDQTDNKQLNVWGWADFHIFLISCFIESSQGNNNEGSITPSTSNVLYEVMHL